MHERPAPYGPRLNLAVVLADAVDASSAAPSCTVHLLRGGFYAGRLTAIGRAGGDLARATLRLSQIFFSGDAGRAGTTGHDIDWQLIGTYLRKEREKVNVLDLDECASAEEAGRRLRILIEAAAGNAGRVVVR